MDENTAEYSISWQGTVTGPYSIKEIRSMLKSGRINSLYRIKVEGEWLMLRDYLAQIDRAQRDLVSRKEKYSGAQLAHSDIGKINQPAPHVVTEIKESLSPEMPSSDLPCFHVNRRGQKLGPFTRDQIQDMLNSGMLSTDDLYWKEGNQDWLTIRNAFQRTNPPLMIPQAERRASAANLSSVYPGFWLRLGAYLIDSVLSSVVIFIAAFLWGFTMAASGVYDRDLIEGSGSIIGVLGVWLYYALFESSSKQATPGKLAFDFVVTDMNGERISFGKATARYFGMILSGLMLGFGFIMCAFTEKKQCLHDILAGCLMFKKNN